MGVEVVCGDRVKCDHCKEKKIDIFKVLDSQYYCSECCERLGSKDFRDAMRELKNG